MNFIFYDLETTGRNICWDQILQIGAILTNEKFEVLDSFEAKCYLKPGHIPSPTALLVNKTTAENLNKTNLSHYNLIQQIEKKFRSWSPAIFIGYNSINFDEEFLRNSFFKSLHDPYITINDGNKRADLLGLVRSAHIFFPEILKIPLNEKGNTTFKLDQIAPLNGIHNFSAHDAMGDTIATMKLAKLMNRKNSDLWHSSLLTTSKEEVNMIIEKEEVFCITESFFGKTMPFVVTFICYHPKYNWAQCFDLKHDPSNYINLSTELLEHSMSLSPKIIRSVRNNKHPLIMYSNHIIKLKDYSHLSIMELARRSKILNANEDFKEKIRLILDKQSSEREHPVSQLDINYEETIYQNFSSNKEKLIMKDFHDADWKDKISVAEKFKEERNYYFAERLIYEESPHSLPKNLYENINRKIAKQILSSNSEKWNTIPEAYKEIDDLRSKYEEEDNKNIIEILNSLNKFIEDIEKKYQDA